MLIDFIHGSLNLIAAYRGVHICHPHPSTLNYFHQSLLFCCWAAVVQSLISQSIVEPLCYCAAMLSVDSATISG